jgi:hypothetical protein
MYCPLHDDKRRSASLNIKTGDFFCFAGCGGRNVLDLIKDKEHWVGASQNGAKPTRDDIEVASESQVSSWNKSLLDNLDDSLTWLSAERGITPKTARRFQLGWDARREVVTIPVRDRAGALLNVRRYNPRPAPGKRKIWGLAGRNAPQLYPINQLRAKTIIICEGEWDALRTIQEGHAAITRTGSAGVWDAAWSRLFRGKHVLLCHDRDAAGATANRRVGKALRRVAADVRVIELPYPLVDDHGRDLTDFWRDYDNQTFQGLIAAARPYEAQADADDAELVSVLASYDAERVGRPTRLMVTVRGKREPGYTVPRQARLTCSQDAGTKCKFCPMMGAGGEANYDIRPSDPAVLEMMDSSSTQLSDIIRRSFGAVKCNRLSIETTGHQAVEVLFARPSIDHSSQESAEDYRNVKITSVGRHDTLANFTVEATGALYPNPRSQSNEFLAWDISRQETSVDNFTVDDDVMHMLKRFQPRYGQRPLSKLVSISKELSEHVTKIYGRPEMHALMDLVWHSILSFKFGDEVVQRGWLEGLVLGDTRTGKSEAARSLSRHYDAGEVVSCEAASFAGIIGGLQQFGSGKEWAVTWGAVPINDRRLVVLDEVSGLTPEQISQMSDVRSSGQAKITKITQELTWARTRLLWLSNPRNSKMSDYTYGVQAIQPLIGNPEDISRFDLAMTVALGDVKPDEINRPHRPGKPRYHSEACQLLVRWCWTRSMEQVVWDEGAEEEVYRSALDMGARYTEDPPLVQVANVRIKIARVAVALAARLFSTDPTGELVVIKPAHVRDAVAFLDKIYSMRTMGYAERSREALEDARLAESYEGEVKQYLDSWQGLPKFLRMKGTFRRQDLEEILNMQREQANGIINKLWQSRMVRKEGQDVKVEPVLQRILREIP